MGRVARIGGAAGAERGRGVRSEVGGAAEWAAAESPRESQKEEKGGKKRRAQAKAQQAGTLCDRSSTLVQWLRATQAAAQREHLCESLINGGRLGSHVCATLGTLPSSQFFAASHA